ncbi:hypothetical protein [Ferruginivarius sediminum]|uniref:N-acetyltransferase domain-containing protein n=1 Tax=Ferruginivarius sediminum TaxID=2661937 RepID=A0A369T764_9PROT|nr:hypothetical protein [Ferruginivarius sediminum]RDD61179.1 hypothetical protein DRB17_13905 [Ferruginivarius sediminum]
MAIMTKSDHLQAEEVERAALADLHAAAPAELRQRLGMRLEEIDGGLASIIPAIPSIVLNRVQGLGLDAPVRREAIGRIREAYADAGVERYFVHVHPEARPAELRGWLEDAGFRPRRRWMKFIRGRDAAPAARSDLNVREIGPEDAGAFARIVSEGFDLGEGGVELLPSLVGRPGWHIYMSFDGSEPAGTGALFIHGKAAWFDYGATTKAKRGRGGQAALLSRRIAHALDVGCEIMFTTTGEWVEGDPQHSYRNIQRSGFQEDYARDNYALS